MRFLEVTALLSLAFHCLRAELTYTISEGMVSGTYLGDIATDAAVIGNLTSQDAGLYKFVQLTPEFSNNSTRLFRVTKKHGRLYTAQEIDAEVVCAYYVECYKVVDVAVYYRSSFVRLIEVRVFIKDINDQTPEFPLRQTNIEFSERDIKGTQLSIPSATDKDVSTRNSRISYELKKGKKDPFALTVLERVHSKVKLSIQLEGSLDREFANSYFVQVVARDMGLPRRQSILDIRILVSDENDNVPVFSQSIYNVSIGKLHEKSKPIISLTATDLDFGNNSKVTYRYSSDTLDTTKSQFELNKETGEIFLSHGSTPISKGQYKLYVEAEDEGKPPLSSIAMVLVDVASEENHPPIIDINVASVDEGVGISEGSDIGSFVAYLKVTDFDKGIDGEAICDLSHEKFQLEQFGTKKYKIILKDRLDREEQEVHDLIIECEDKGTPSLSSKKTLSIQVFDVNDQRPLFSTESFKFLVAENEKPGINAGFINVSDPDTGTGAHLSFSLLTSNEEFLPFKISEEGVITTSALLDREFQSLYKFQVFVKDHGTPSLSNMADVIVEVKDKNDHAPYFTFPSVSPHIINITYYPQYSKNITHLRATDDDVQENSLLRYRIMKGNNNALFTIDHSSGMLAFDRMAVNNDAGTYELEIVVKDSGIPVLSAMTRIVLTLSISNRLFEVSNENEVGIMIHLNVAIVIVIVSVTLAISTVLLLTICYIRYSDKKVMALKPPTEPVSKKSYLTGAGTILKATRSSALFISETITVTSNTRQMDDTVPADEGVELDLLKAATGYSKEITVKTNFGKSETKEVVALSEEAKDSRSGEHKNALKMYSNIQNAL